MLTTELVRRGARRHGTRTAVISGDPSLSFREVDETANRMAHVLIGLGVERGTRVGLLVDNGLWSVPIDFACLKAGAVRVPLNARLAADEQARMLVATGVGMLVHGTALAERAGELAGRVPGLRLIGLGPTPDVEALDLLAEMTQASYAAICANILANLVSPGPDSVMLHAASLIHASGTFVLPYWVRGGAAAVLPGFDPGSYLDSLARHRATEINLVPTMLGMLLSSGAAERADVSSLRTAVYGASPMPGPVLTQTLDLWGPRLVQYYGQTEAPLAITVLDAADHTDPTLAGSCGQPAVDAEVRVTAEDGTPLPPGEVGELRVRAPFAMAGYHDAPELTAETLDVDGWVRTRDLARFDDRGYLTLVDRTSDMIITGGYNVYPREVEDALMAHPAVAGAAVVGAPDPTWVEAVTAFVTLRPGAEVTGHELQDAVRSALAGYKVPKSVHVVDQLPLSAVGKVLRRALREPLWADGASPGARP